MEKRPACYKELVSNKMKGENEKYFFKFDKFRSGLYDIGEALSNKR